MCQDYPDIFIFGYGSLIWRPGFPYTRKFNAYVKGFKRRFWQRSCDHRGTPDSPGRVVTIVPTSEYATLQSTRNTFDIEDEDDKVWGTVYCITHEDAQHCLECLDVREKGGYHREEVPVYVEGDIFACMATLYVGSVSTAINTEFIGPENIEDTAKIIACASGLSGPNRDYLYNLADSLRNMSLHDAYLFELERLVRELSQCLPVVCVKTKISDSEPSGTIIIDSGATQAISQRSKGLLPCGIRSVEGEFSEGSVVLVIDQCTKKIVSKGLVNFSAREIAMILGKHSKLVPKILGKNNTHECVISKNFMILT
jgi:cation transport protein ChaC